MFVRHFTPIPYTCQEKALNSGQKLEEGWRRARAGRPSLPAILWPTGTTGRSLSPADGFGPSTSRPFAALRGLAMTGRPELVHRPNAGPNLSQSRGESRQAGDSPFSPGLGRPPSRLAPPTSPPAALHCVHFSSASARAASPSRSSRSSHCTISRCTPASASASACSRT